MASLLCEIDQFDLEGDQAKNLWEEWCERLEQFFIANSISTTDDADRCKAIFLAKVGGKCYSLIRTLCHPDKPNTKSLVDLQKLVKNHLAPPPIVIAERYVFYNRRQTSGESVAEFQNSLRKLAESCDFGEFRPQALRDMFVIGLRDHEVQKKLLSEANLTLEDAFAKAQAAERTRKHVDDMVGEVNKVQISAPRYKNTRVNDAKTSRACFLCGEEGHFKAQCPKRANKSKYQYKKQKVKHVQAGKVDASDSETEYDHAQLHAIRTIGKVSDTVNVPQYLVEVWLNHQPVKMEVDTGASVSIISRKQFERLGLGKLVPTETCLSTITGEELKVLGKCEVSVSYKEQTYDKLQLHVVESTGPPLLGRDWLSQIRLDWRQINNLKEDKIAGSLLGKYSDLFDGQLGKVAGIKAKLELKEGAKPRYLKSRPVPQAIQDNIKEALEQLVADKVLRKIEYSEWASPIVPVKKPSGSYRICGDYSVALNKHLKIPEHPMPNIEELLTKLNGGDKFSKLDLSQAYQQIELDDESQNLVAINTHLGLYTYTRVPYGISAAPSLFQSVMDRVLQGLNCGCYLDDIVVTGKNDQEHLDNLEQVFARLSKYGFKLQRTKCELMKSSIHYLGHTVDSSGVRKDPCATEAIKEAPAPRNKSELRSFLGLANQYRKFVSNMSTITAPLNELLQERVKWYWSDKQAKAFKLVKESIVADTVLAHYSPKEEVFLAVDASPVGLGAVICHGQGKTERPVAFASRTLTEAERNYSQIDREALAIIYGIKKFHYYLYGRKFVLFSDNQPLCHILGSRKGLPSLAAARILRWAIELTNYTFEVRHRPGSKNCCADALSRLPLEAVETNPELVKWTAEARECNTNAIDKLPVTSKQIARYTMSDVILSKVLHYVRVGWPSTVETEYDCYFQKRREISLEENCLLWGNRVIVPEPLRQMLLEELHVGHQGIVKMKSLARLHFWWPKLDQQIEEQVRRCELCQSNQEAPPKLSHISWAWPDRPWVRVHIDFAQFQGDYYLVMVDAHSKWPEVIMMRNGTTAEKTIEAMRAVFSRLGLCEQIVADNGPPFPSKELQSFLKGNGIKTILSPPYHPPSNGAAERFVRTLKSGLKKSTGRFSKLHKLHEFLLVYRSTPHSITGQPPSELLMGRRIRTRLDLVRPDLKSKMARTAKGVLSPQALVIGEKVQARDYRNIRKPGWTEGVIVAKLSPVTYHVQVDLDGVLTVWKRHLDQIKSCDVDIEGESRESMENCMTIPFVDDSMPTPTAEETVEGGRAPVEPPPRPEVVASSAAAGATVGGSVIEHVPAATTIRPNRVKRPPSYLKDYERY